MKHIRFKYVFLVIFAFLFINLLSINVSKVSAEDQNISLDNVYRGEINNYWVLANYGEDFIGDREVTFFLDPDAIDNPNIKYIVVTEMDEYGYHHPVSYKRGVDSNFASRFTYQLVDDMFGKRLIAIFLMEDLTNQSTDIIDKIIIDRLERVRTIENFTSADFVVYQEVEEMTFNPYKVYIEIDGDKHNVCDYKLEEVKYSYYSASKQEDVEGYAIRDTSEGAPCNRFYFVVSENATYNIKVTDIFGVVKPEDGDDLTIKIENFYGDVLNIVATYDDSLTRLDVAVNVEVYKADGSINTNMEILEYQDLDGMWHSIMATKMFTARENGVYAIHGKTSTGSEATIYVNITNIDREAPLVQVSSNLKVNTSEVEGGINRAPSGVVLVFNPINYVLATDNKTDGDILYDNDHFSAVYRTVSEADSTCKNIVGNIIDGNVYDYLYGVNDVCAEFTIKDEAGNSRTVNTKISMFDDTIPTVSSTKNEITIEIGDAKPTDEELEALFGLIINDNSRRYLTTCPGDIECDNPIRQITIDGDMSKVNVEELNRYPVYITATDGSGNVSETLTLTVIVTVKILRISTEVVNPYIVYGDELPEDGIPYSCNGNPCENEILPADLDKLNGQLYIPSGSRYAGSYPISSSLFINSKKYSIELLDLGQFTIKPRTFKVIANSFKIYYLDEEPVLTWYVDTSVCSGDLSTLYTNFYDMNYSCTFADSRDYFAGASEFSIDNTGRVIYKGGLIREEGTDVLFDDNGEVSFYKINLGNLKVVEADSGGRVNYAIDFYGIDYKAMENGNLVLIGNPKLNDKGDALEAGEGYAQLYIYPKHIEITMKDVTKIYGESDPNTSYDDEFTNKLNESTGGSYQYEFTCRAFDKDDGGPVQDWCTRGSESYSLSKVHEILDIYVTRDPGETVPEGATNGRYRIQGHASNNNFKIEFNSELSSGFVEDAYLIINKRDITISIDGENNDGKYTIFYEDPLPQVTFTNDSENDDIPYNGLANGEYRNINNLSDWIVFADRIDNGDNPVKFLDSMGNPINNSIGGYPVYVDGVGRYTITNDTITIMDKDSKTATNNYNLTFKDGILDVIQRLIYVQVVEGLDKTYGDNDPIFDNDYLNYKNQNDPLGHSNHILERDGNYVLRIIDTVKNSGISDNKNYQPFDKDKLLYDLERGKDSPLFDALDVHEGETVGSYPVILKGFEYTNNQESNYIIKIYQDYEFKITPRILKININDGEIEFNYQNDVPNFSYGFDGLVFSDSLIGQPMSNEFDGDYRNNGNHKVNKGNITVLNVQPYITSLNNYWYINGKNTNVSLDDFENLTYSNLSIHEGKYQIMDIAKRITIDTNVDANEIDMMWNYEFEVSEGNLKVIARKVIIVPLEDDSNKKQYGDKDPEDNAIKFTTKHYVDGEVIDVIEAILDYTDFTGKLDREKGEKPGKYQIINYNLAPAVKGKDNGYNFEIIDIEKGHYFEITKRKLVVYYLDKYTVCNEEEGYCQIERMYGESDIETFDSGFKYGPLDGQSPKTSLAVSSDPLFCTNEIVNGVEECMKIADEIIGELYIKDFTGQIGSYEVSASDLSIVRIDNNDVNVEAYYDFSFVPTTINVIPRVLYITPLSGQYKIYGNDGGESCEIKFEYTTETGGKFHLIEEGIDKFSGCLEREPIEINGNLTTEDVGSYPIGLGSLTVSGNYDLQLRGTTTYNILQRNLVINIKVYGDKVKEYSNGGITTFKVEYGYDYTIGYEEAEDGLANNDKLGIHDEFINFLSIFDEENNRVEVNELTIGRYFITQGSLTVTNSRNYHITCNPVNFEISEREIVILPDSLSKIYQDEDPELTYTIINDDPDSLPTPSGKLSRIEGEFVGEYLIGIGDLNYGKGYTIRILENVFFVIKPRDVIVIPDGGQFKIYGSEKDPQITFDCQVIGRDIPCKELPWQGALTREEGEEAGFYKILQGELRLSNYNIILEDAYFEIRYIEITEIIIYSKYNNKYQINGKESDVELWAEFNKGADKTYEKDIAWSVIKNGVDNYAFEKNANNEIKFRPYGIGNYLVIASYNGISATYEVLVRNNNIDSIKIHLGAGESATRLLGEDKTITYDATITLLEERDEDIYIEWIVGDIKVCEHKVDDKEDKCTFNTKNLPIGVHKVYAQIGTTVSDYLELTIKDNAAPVITMYEQGEIYYIEVFTNSISTKQEYSEKEKPTAFDDIDGDLTDYITVKGLYDIDYWTVGTYYVIYEVVDQHGHVANNYRTIVIQDTVAPTLTLKEGISEEMYIEYGTYYEVSVDDAIASDEYDNYHGRELTVYMNSNLDIEVIGDYEIIYFAVDSNGLRGFITRTIHIQDHIKPTITLIGEDYMLLEYKEKFRDPGALFQDNYDGEFIIYPSSITFAPKGSSVYSPVDSVDTSLLGIYSLTYSQKDSSENDPVSEARRIVEVKDRTPPVITLLGSNPYILRYGTEYVEPGYKVIDNYDGDITNNSDLVKVRPVIGDTLGTYYVYYNAIDTNGNSTIEVKRTVIILDLVSPIIYFTDVCPQYMTVEALIGEYDTRCDVTGYGYTVYDDYTPDIDNIQNWVRVTGTVDTTTIGVYEIKYDVSDRSGNAAITLIRYVSVVDTTPPTIELMPNEDGDINFYVEVFSQYVEPGYKAHDIYDDYHNLTIKVDVTNNININKLNTYTVTYIAIDNAGNESEPVYREITVRDTVPPVVTLIGEQEIYIERGGTYAEYNATAIDNYDRILRNITIEGAPTGKELGYFPVKYCATDSSGNTGCAIRDVYVQDTIAPVILGVTDGAYYRSPLYIYYSPLTGTDEILTGKLNNELINSPWYVSKDGIYNLVVHDDAGNTTTVNFVIDRVAPVVLGANDGEYINHDVTIFSDEKLKSITYRLNNGGYVSTTDQSIVFETEGQYWVYVTDMAGNVSGVKSFVIDKTPPSYSLEGVLNKGITNTDVHLVSEEGVTVSVNNQYIPTTYTFTENGYYKVTIRDIAGNDVFLQFVINKNPTVTINNTSVTFISQNNAIDEFVAIASKSYPKGSGFIYAKPLLDGTFQYIKGTLFSDEEYSKLISGEDLTFDVPSVSEDEMVVSFVVTLDELNKFTTQTVEGDDDSAIMYAIIAIAVAGLIGSMFYFFIIIKRKKDEEEEEDEVTIEEDDYY